MMLNKFRGGLGGCITAACGLLMIIPQAANAWRSDDRTWEVRGFLENASYARNRVGWTRHRYTGQMEFNKDLGSNKTFSELYFGGTLRASFDAVYDFSADYGDDAGGSRSFAAPGNPAFFSYINGGAPPFTDVPTNPVYAGTFGPVAAGANGAIPLPGTGGTLNSPDNPNEGLIWAAEEVYDYDDGGVALATPVRPCDVDSRGCIDDWLDKDEDDLKYPGFNDRLDVIRELFVGGSIPLNETEELGFRFGRQQVVWGRTDLFRVLDVINPVDFSRNNIFDELEDSRIPMGMLTMEYRKGATQTFEDLNFQMVWKWEKFRPHDFGQGGEPYSVLGIGNTLRALKNCWDNGCTVGNFPAPGVAVDFPRHSLGIRDVKLPDWDAGEIGFRMEGVYEGVGFSMNALRYRSQFPSLKGGIPSVNPFAPPGTAPAVHPYALVFDVEFPWITLLGGSADFYVEPLKAAIRVEGAYTRGEEFPDTSKADLNSGSDVFRWVIGIDRPTFIPFLNDRRAFLISAQLFGQHLLDHDTSRVNSAGIPTKGPVGFTDLKDNYVATLLIQGNYMNDRLTPQVITAWDFGAKSGAVVPSVDWRIGNNWRINLAANIKFGKGPRSADDNRSANPYPPATCAPPLATTGSPLCGSAYSSLGVSGFEPLGRFKSGPFGTGINEDEVQLTVRYQF